MQLRDVAIAATRRSVLPPHYHRLFWTWFAFGFPAFGSVLGDNLADDHAARDQALGGLS